MAGASILAWAIAGLILSDEVLEQTCVRISQMSASVQHTDSDAGASLKDKCVSDRSADPEPNKPKYNIVGLLSVVNPLTRSCVGIDDCRFRSMGV